MTTTSVRPAPLHEPGLLRIGGRAREARDGARSDVLDPATGEVLTTVAAATAQDVDDAVAAARTAFDSGDWARRHPRERAAVLQRAAALLRERADELAAVESHDVGKPLTVARYVDVETAALTYEYAAGLVTHLDGSLRRVPSGAHAFVRRDPAGVVAAITPFNFPLVLSTTKIATALVAGCTVVHKPASATPLSALLVADLLAEAGLPDGVLQVVTGSGDVVGDHLVTHPGVDAVTFTGSTEVGRRAASLAGGALRPFTAELGGNGAHLVLADADLDAAVASAVQAFTFNTGQFCMSGPRLLVERAVHDEVLERLAAAVPAVTVGDPRDPATAVGPLATAAQRDRVERLVEDAVARGARVVVGGGRPDGPGWFHRPTVLADVDPACAAVQEEVFGPVLTVQPFDSEDEAVALANGPRQHLAVGVASRDVARALRLVERLRAGICWVNGWAQLDPGVPYGGVGDSGWGRESGPESLETYLRSTSVVVDLGRTA